VLVRSAVFALVVLVAETVPTFGPVVDVIGGTAVTATSIVLPCLFYLYLNAWETKTFGVCVSKTSAIKIKKT
jgi:amino acid permease